MVEIGDAPDRYATRPTLRTDVLYRSPYYSLQYYLQRSSVIQRIVHNESPGKGRVDHASGESVGGDGVVADSGINT